MLDVFLGKSDKGRDNLILEATSRTAFREGDWVLIPPYNGAAINKFVNIELGNSNEFQLYNLKEDKGQEHNLAATEKEKLDEMLQKFLKIRGESYKNNSELELK